MSTTVIKKIKGVWQNMHAMLRDCNSDKYAS